jgi:predicted TIM-barrel fold metal-dependent hydrolase
MGVPRASAGESAYRNISQLLALAKHPNIGIKATGQAACSTEEYPFRDIHPHLKAVYDAFGPRRMFWGTDITRQHCSWKQCITLFTEELSWLKGEDLELVMGRAYCDWVAWKV